LTAGLGKLAAILAIDKSMMKRRSGYEKNELVDAVFTWVLIVFRRRAKRLVRAG
jgi:hypothetical protein